MNYNLESFTQFANDVFNKLNELQRTVSETTKTPEPDKWLTIDELVQYDPEKRAKQTFYGLVSRGLIPYHKRGKRLTFLKSEIDQWLRSASRVSIADVEQNKGV
ncbi:MAG: helix-turn-helix domain-containing protein [Bacteroidetes bacterium]|nr:helix-turn-helix domain-containing protein [Bacteroidota bacterium]